MQVDDYGFRGQQEEELQKRGIVSPIAALRVFQPLATYNGLVPPPRPRGVPVLDDLTKPSGGVPNFNNIEYVTISNRFLHDFVQILLARARDLFTRRVGRGEDRGFAVE